ncbi:MAG: hypothetical protein O2857_13680, partial [Planctomycetota bacterium]|nr:hypothetical protein [Planctomycetota bacterium]
MPELRTSIKSHFFLTLRASGIASGNEKAFQIGQQIPERAREISSELPARVHEGLKAVRLSSEIYTL